MTPTRCHLVRFLSLSLTCHLTLYDLLLLNESISRWSLQFVFQLASLLKAFHNISKPEKFISHTQRDVSMLALTVRVISVGRTRSFQFTAQKPILWPLEISVSCVPDAAKVSFETISSRRCFLVR